MKQRETERKTAESDEKKVRRGENGPVRNGEKDRKNKSLAVSAPTDAHVGCTTTVLQPTNVFSLAFTQSKLPTTHLCFFVQKA